MTNKNNNKLKIQFLNSIFMKKGFIIGEEICDYEKYLLELVNNSSYFLSKSNGEKYLAPNSESDGENDCNSKEYRMDFKIIGGAHYIKAKSELDGGVKRVSKEIVVYTAPKKVNEEIRVPMIYSLLKNETVDDLLKYKNENLKYDFYEESEKYEINNFVKVLSTKKNLFLYFPFKLTLDKIDSLDVLVFEISEFLLKYYKSSLEYRLRYFNEFDTYLSVIGGNDYLFIYKFLDHSFHFVDKVELNKSPSYLKLNEYVKFSAKINVW